MYHGAIHPCQLRLEVLSQARGALEGVFANFELWRRLDYILTHVNRTSVTVTPFGAQGSGSRVSGLMFRVHSSGCRVFGFRVQGSGFRVQGLRFRV